MKLSQIAISGVLALGMVSAANATEGNYGKVHFYGEITESPCDLTNPEQDVYMGQISLSNLNQGLPSGMVPFKLILTNCHSSTLTTTKTAFTGDAGPVVVADSFNVAQGGVNMADVGLVITDHREVNMDIEASPVVKPSVTVDQAWEPFNGSHTLEFGAYLKGVTAGTATAGNFTSDVNFTIQYQ